MPCNKALGEIKTSPFGRGNELVSTGICDLHFRFARNARPAALSRQRRIAILLPGGIAARSGSFTESPDLFGTSSLPCN